MTTSTDKPSTPELPDLPEAKKKKGPKGPIRWSAVIPALVITILLALYGKYAFDGHLRKLIIWSAEAIHGAEVNLSKVSLSLIKGDLLLKGLQVTNKDEPQKNLIEIETINFHLNTYELLKAKFIVENSEVTGIKWDSLRSKPGKIYPKNTESSKALDKIEEATLNTAKENLEGNILGNVANVLSGSEAKTELKDIKSELITEQKIKELENEAKSKEERYKETLADLKSKKDLEEIKSEAKEYKWDKKDPIGSLKKLNDLIKTVKTKADKYKSDLDSVKEDLKTIKYAQENFDQWIEQDLQNLQTKVGIPSLDPEKLAFSLFGNYFGTNVAKFQKYSEVVKEYMPPPKDQRRKETLIPPPRGEGKTYEFPKVGENPKVWVKKVSISSQAGSSEYGGNIEGTITDITTSPAIIDRPVKFLITGGFPKQQILGSRIEGTLDHRTNEPEQNVKVFVESFPFPQKKLSSSEDLSLALQKSPASLSFDAKKKMDQVNISLETFINGPKFDVNAKKELVKEIVSNSLKRMDKLSIKGSATGALEALKWKFASNIGSVLANGFKEELKGQIAKAKQELRQKIESKIAPQREKLEGQYKKIKNDLDAQINEKSASVKNELNEVLESLKSKQGSSVKEETKKVEKKAKKLLKSLFK